MLPAEGMSHSAAGLCLLIPASEPGPGELQAHIYCIDCQPTAGRHLALQTYADAPMHSPHAWALLPLT